MLIRNTLLFICLWTFSWANGQDQVLLTKKEAKFVNGLLLEDWQAEAVIIPDLSSSATSLMLEGDRIYLLRQQDAILGYLLSTRALGRFDYFDYLLAYAPDFSVLGLTVTVYRSSHGAAICQKRWLSQFEGYAGKELTLGKEIDAVSGATISATALVKDMSRCYQLIIALKEEGIIQ